MTTVGSGIPVKQQQQQEEQDPGAAPSDDNNDETHHQSASSHHSRSAILPLYTRPVQRQRWGDTQIHPVVNWGDLFFDLFYVAAAYNLSGIIRALPNNNGLLYFCGAFFSIMHQWFDKMYYDARFYTRDDLYHRIYEVCVLVCIATAILHIRPTLHDSSYNSMFVLCLSLSIGTVLTMLRYLEMIICGCDGQPVATIAAKRDCLSKVMPLGFQLAAMGVAAYQHYNDNVDDSGRRVRLLAEDTSASAAADYSYDEHNSSSNLPIWLLCGGALSWLGWFTFIIVTFPKNGAHKAITVPMNIDFCIHRYGEWTMLMLGESILSLLIVNVSDNRKYYITFYAGILSVVLLQYMHFRSQPHHADEHAMRRSKEAGFAYSILMQIYSAALIVLGVDYKMLLYEYTYESSADKRRLSTTMFRDLSRWLASDTSSSSLPYTKEDRQQRIAHFFCGSLAIVFFCSDAMILAHKGLKDNMGRCRCKQTGQTKVIGIVLILLRGGLIAFVATLSQYETDPELLALIGLASICAQLFLRVVSTVVFPDDQVHDDKVGSHGVPEDPEEDKWPNVTQALAVQVNDSSSPVVEVEGQ